jgi:hypothetical protein
LNSGPWVDGQDGVPDPLRRFPPVCLCTAISPCGTPMWLIVKVGAYDIPAVLIPATPHTEYDTGEVPPDIAGPSVPVRSERQTVVR